MSFAACELLARNFPVCVIPTERNLREQDQITLPNGRVLPICHEPERIKASFFCDVIWNGVADYNYALVPTNSLKYAWLVYDSDQLPPRWVQLLNQHFDLVVTTSPHLIDVAEASGVENPIACLPIPLDLDLLLAQSLLLREKERIRFGSVVAFHPRKGTLTLIEAFRRMYAARQDVELVLHSNLAFGDYLDQARQLAGDVPNIQITCGDLSAVEKNRLIQSFDVFINCSHGEGYSIGAREALALGKALVVSDIGAHKDLLEQPGVFRVPAELAIPARYPEIDNGVFGQQRAARVGAVADALGEAMEFARSDEYDRTVYARRVAARDFSFDALSIPFATLFNPDIPSFRRRSTPPNVRIPEAFTRVVQKRLGRRANTLSAVRHQVCRAYDGGFFSIFNAFMSHLVWQQREDRCHAVYPDWDVDRLLEQMRGERILSFCYGQPGDGNLWLHLFEPLFGSTAAEMNDPSFLYHHASEPENQHNTDREPLMTYVHAYRLYRTRDFAAWRRQYHRVFREHVHLRPPLQAELNDFANRCMSRPFMIAAHVRHPSHTVEQPGAVIAREETYIRRIYGTVASHGFDRAGHDWGVFLATDQERVVRRFRDEFGDRLACYSDVRRTVAAEDAAFEALPINEQNSDGHQLQHLVAADRSSWSVRMAWEVVRDAYCMARCQVLLHVVSNVSTAVAYMNPELEMVFCEA